MQEEFVICQLKWPSTLNTFCCFCSVANCLSLCLSIGLHAYKRSASPFHPSMQRHSFSVGQKKRKNGFSKLVNSTSDLTLSSSASESKWTRVELLLLNWWWHVVDNSPHRIRNIDWSECNYRVFNIRTRGEAKTKRNGWNGVTDEFECGDKRRLSLMLWMTSGWWWLCDIETVSNRCVCCLWLRPHRTEKKKPGKIIINTEIISVRRRFRV